MSVVINKVWSGFFNSNPLSGSTNQSADGSQFSVNMNTPLKILASAISCRMAVLSASIWNTSPNVSPLFKNNLFRYSVWNNILYHINTRRPLFTNRFTKLSFESMGSSGIFTNSI